MHPYKSTDDRRIGTAQNATFGHDTSIDIGSYRLDLSTHNVLKRNPSGVLHCLLLELKRGSTWDRISSRLCSCRGIEAEGPSSTELRNFTPLSPASSCFFYLSWLRHRPRLKIPRLSPERLQIHRPRLWLEQTSPSRMWILG